MYCQVVSKSELAAGVLGLAGLVLGSVKEGLVRESVVKSLGPGSAWEDLNPGASQAPRTTWVGLSVWICGCWSSPGKGQKTCFAEANPGVWIWAGGAARGCYGVRVSFNPESTGAGLESRLAEISLMLE